MENGKAVDLAEVLNRIFEPRQAGKPAPPAQLAPGLKPADIRSEGAGGDDRDRQPAVSDRDRPAAGPGEGLLIGAGSEVRIIADEANNALVIMATAQQYRQVVRVLKALDIAPLQVLIEATIAEVTLTGDLSLGLEWFLDHRLGRRRGEAQLDLGAAGLAPTLGFSYLLRNGADIRLVFNALASESRLNIVSSPSLMVLNNQTASIQVGDQVPVTTQQQQATSTTSNVINNVEFRDTGVLLTVTPRVNPGGLVVLELEQEVSDVAPGSANSLTPIIQQRKIVSTVAVQSGETVVLGGLIRGKRERNSVRCAVLLRDPGDWTAVQIERRSDSTHRAGRADHAASGAGRRRGAPNYRRAAEQDERPGSVPQALGSRSLLSGRARPARSARPARPARRAGKTFPGTIRRGARTLTRDDRAAATGSRPARIGETPRCRRKWPGWPPWTGRNDLAPQVVGLIGTVPVAIGRPLGRTAIPNVPITPPNADTP